MPPKVRITREMILQAAYAIAREQGAEQINARVIAERLGCSTQPVLYQFGHVEDIRREVYRMADEYQTACLMQPREDTDPMTAIGLNYIRFAAQEPRLFIHLFLRPVDVAIHPLSGQEIKNELVAKECAFSGVDEAKAARVYTELSIYAHGFAALFASGHACADMDTVRQMLTDAYRAIVMRLNA